MCYQPDECHVQLIGIAQMKCMPVLLVISLLFSLLHPQLTGQAQALRPPDADGGGDHPTKCLQQYEPQNWQILFNAPFREKRRELFDDDILLV